MKSLTKGRARLMLFLSLAIFFLAPTFAFAATYYVDNCVVTGNDSNNGTDPTTPWLTINKVNISSFAPGDSILFHKGCTWREQLTVPSSGSAGNPITFGAYGSGANPKFIGSNALSTWDTNSVAGVSADLLTETFNATSSGGHAITTAGSGYTDLNGWVGNLGSGSVMDADNTAIADPDGGSSQILKIDKVSPNYSSLVRWRTAGDNAISYTTFYVYVTAEGLSNGTSVPIFSTQDTAFTNTTGITFQKTLGGAYQFYASYYTNGGGSVTTLHNPTVALNTWYKIEIEYDVTNKVFEWRVNGSVMDTITLTGSLVGGPRDWRFGDAGTSRAVTVYFDNLRVGTTGYYVPATAKTWKAASAANPATVSFIDPDGTIHRGNKVSGESTCNNLYDWYRDGSYVYVNSGGTSSGNDPDTLWSSIEISTRAQGIFISSKNYITVQNISTYFANENGIFFWADSDYGTVSSSDASYNGQFGITGGVNGTAAPDNVTVSSNTTSYNGHSGISIGDYSTAWTVSHNISHHNSLDYTQSWSAGIYAYGNNSGDHVIEYNTVYSNGGSDSALGQSIGVGIWLDTVNQAGTHTTSGVVRYNKVYGNRAGGIFLEKNNDVNCSYNVVYGNNLDGLTYIQAGIQVDAFGGYTASNNKIYNNTVYGNSAGILLRADTANKMLNNLVKNNISTGNTLRQFSAQLGGNNDGTYGSGNVYAYNDFGPQSSNFIEWGTGVYKSTYSDWETAYGGTTNSVQTDPLFTNTGTSDLTLQSTSPAIDTGVSLGDTYKLGLNPNSVWPGGVNTLDQNLNGAGWEIGAYVLPAIRTSTINQLQGGSYLVAVANTPPVTSPLTPPAIPNIAPPNTPTITFNANHHLGDKGEDILTLQKWLNTHGFILATTGPGSPGNETSTFGNKTKQAIIKFQKAHNLTPDGILGPITRSMLLK